MRDRFQLRLLDWSRSNFFVFGFMCLVWYGLRTGSKPTRSIYPCQRAAALNANLWLATYMFPVFSIANQALTKENKKIIALIGGVGIIAGVLYFGFGVPWLKFNGNGQNDVPNGVEEVMSSIFVVEETNGDDEGLTILLSSMADQGQYFYQTDGIGELSGPDGFISSDDVVLIKVNCQWNQRGGTNTDLVKSIIQAVVDHPDGFTGEVVIADNGQAQYGGKGMGGSLDWEENNAVDRSQSMQDVADSFTGFKVSTYLWDAITTTEVDEYDDGDQQDGFILGETASSQTGLLVSYPKFRTSQGTYVSFKRGIWDPEAESYDSDRLKVINVPVLKSHCNYGVTGAVKHYMGVPSEILTTNEGHSTHDAIGKGGMGTLMADTRYPTLNILDCIYVNVIPWSGPMTEYDAATYAGIIAVSTDPVALDYWASKNVLLKLYSDSHGRTHDSMNPDNTRKGSFGNWLRLSMNELNLAGYKTTVNEDQIAVWVSAMN